MTPAALTVLHQSIEIWQRRAVDGTANDDYSCPLCDLFNHYRNVKVAHADTCKGCPVFEHTGKVLCDETPYYAWEAYTDIAEPDPDVLKSLARAELQFLQSLLPTP